MKSPARAQELREALAATHRVDPESGVYLRQDAPAFHYSDGAEAEAHVARAIREARDIAVGSAELASRIRDWPSRYHLGTARQNLLRPIAAQLGGLVLEVGAGCGAMTRLLGETGATVLAVEGSPSRAAIAASRCRDLPNVVVACDNFANLALATRFDWVTLIGVLEYSRMFLGGADPVHEMLAKAHALLARGGALALAIENQLGLKYLAGAHEDHTGTAWFGVNDRYGAATPVTFGEGELRRRLAKAGFDHVQGLYPFPDYKQPAAIVTENGFGAPAFNATDFIATAMRRHDPANGALAFSESLARGVFIRNGLGAATANSFFFLAAKDEPGRTKFVDPAVLAFGYSPDRVRAYAKQARIVATPAGLRVTRTALYETAPAPDAPARLRLEDEDYIAGEVLYRELERLVANADWTAADVAAWMQPLARLLQSHAQPALAPRFFDCTPFNVVRRESDGALVPFDLEWEPTDGAALEVGRVVFRGLWNSLARVDNAASPAPGTPVDACTLCLAVMEQLGLAATEAQALEWIRGEHRFSGAASGADADLPGAIPRFDVAVAREHLFHPPASFKVQAYFAAPGEGYGEDRSVAATAEGARMQVRLPLPARPYAAIRLDPLDAPGVIVLERVAVVDAADSIAWETRRCRPPDFASPNQYRDHALPTPDASGSILHSEGIDPYFDLAIPPQALARLEGGGALIVEMRRLEAAELAALARSMTRA